MASNSSQIPSQAEIYAEPFVYTSTATKFGQSGYQLLIRGQTLLSQDGEDYVALVTLLKQAGQIPISEGDTPAIIYTPLGHGVCTFISITWIKDWSGRPGAAASALVVKKSSLDGTTPAEVADFLRGKPQLFMSHNTAVRLVTEDTASKACPIVKPGITLALPAGSAPALGEPQLPSVFASAEALWTDKPRAHAAASDDAYQLLRSFLWLSPAAVRTSASFIWNSAGELTLPLPSILLWRPGDTSQPTTQRFPTAKAPASEEAKALLELFRSKPAQLLELAKQVIRQGGGQTASPTQFWREIIDQYNIEQALAGQSFLDPAIKPARVAQALDALQRGAVEKYDLWLEKNGAVLFSHCERFLAVMAAFFAKRDAYGLTLTRLRKQLPVGLAALFKTQTPAEILAPYAADLRLVEPLLLPAFELWLSTSPAPLQEWQFLTQVQDPKPWARAIAKQAAWLDAALGDPIYQAIAETLLAEVSTEPEKLERIGRHFGKAAIGTKDDQVITWALRQPGILTGLGAGEFENLDNYHFLELSTRFREASVKGMIFNPANCWALLRSPRSNPTLRQTMRDCLLLLAREGARYTEDQLAEFIQSLDRDAPPIAEVRKRVSATKDAETLIELHFSTFSDAHTFEHRFLGLRLRAELQRLDCDISRLAAKYRLLQQQQQASLAPTRGLSAVPMPATRAQRSSRDDESWFRQYRTPIIVATGALLVFVIFGFAWRYYFSAEAAASRTSAALLELRVSK